MTSGGIYSAIIRFAVPLLLGSLFQQMYNTVDSVVVGNYVGHTALAAVGSATPVINVIIMIFQGLAVGGGVVISQSFGARNIEKERKAVHTLTAVGLLAGLFLTVFGIFMSRRMLVWVHVPADVMDQARTYLTIFFAGVISLVMYNVGTGVLQATGDSRHPLYYLMITSVFNIVLDIILVRYMHLGVSGAAYATILSEFISMCLVMREMMVTEREFRLDPREVRIDLPVLKEVIRIGVPSALQGFVVSISNLVVMGYINGFGSAAVAGYTASGKVDAFLTMPIYNLGMTMATFCGQNLGAGRIDRVKAGVRAGLVLSCSIVVAVGAFEYLNAGTLIGLFTDDAEVIRAGSIILRIMAPFYIFLAVHHIYSGALRASGRSFVQMISSIAGMVVMRQVYLAVAVRYSHDISIIGWCFSLTWVLCFVITSGYYFLSGWLRQEEEKAAL